MEVKEVIITPYARQTLLYVFEFIKEETSASTANKFREDFLIVIEQIDKNYFAYSECRFLPTKIKLTEILSGIIT